MDKIRDMSGSDGKLLVRTIKGEHWYEHCLLAIIQVIFYAMYTVLQVGGNHSSIGKNSYKLAIIL